MRFCARCGSKPCKIRCSSTNSLLCSDCFIRNFEDEVGLVIEKYGLFKHGDRVAIGVSGGKGEEVFLSLAMNNCITSDSSALLHCLSTLNERNGYGLDLQLLAIDEGISGYRDGSLECVFAAERKYKLPLTLLSFKDLYGWTMDEIVEVLGPRQNCAYCGTFRRQALERGALLLKCDKIATGHNADDSIETLFLNLIRGDFNRLIRCNGPLTQRSSEGMGGGLPRVKPFFLSSQKDVVMYCHCLKLDYFSTECKYSVTAFRGELRNLIKAIEREDPTCVRHALLSSETLIKYLLGGAGAEVSARAGVTAAGGTGVATSGGEKSPDDSCCSFSNLPSKIRHQGCKKCSMPATADECQACHLISNLNSFRSPAHR